MQNRIRCALIGLGNQAMEHLTASIDHPDIEIVVGIDPSQECWEKVQNQFPQSKLKYFENLNTLKTSSIQIDAFILALPHHAYTKIWQELIDYGKPLLKEKPLGRDYQEALSFMQTAQQAQCGLQTAIQRRSHPSYKYLFEQIKPKRLNIYELSAHLHLGKEPQPLQPNQSESNSSNWRAERSSSGGGALLDAGYHLIDLIQYYIGDFDVISATMWNGDYVDNGYDIEDRCWLVGRSAETWLMLDTWVQGDRNESGQLIKSEAIILSTDQGIYKATREGVWLDEVQIFSTDRDWTRAMHSQLSHFAHNIRCNQWHSDVIIDQLPAMRKIEEAYRLSSRY